MPKVTFLANGQTYECAAGTSFLDLCQKHDAPHDFGCTVGGCGTCRLELVSGAQNVSGMTDDERDTIGMVTDVAGARLGCQIKILGDIQVRPVP